MKSLKKNIISIRVALCSTVDFYEKVVHLKLQSYAYFLGNKCYLTQWDLILKDHRKDWALIKGTHNPMLCIFKQKLVVQMSVGPTHK